MDAIDQAIAAGTFDFAQEFPGFRLKSRVPPPLAAARTDETAETALEEVLAKPLPPAGDGALSTAPISGPMANIPKKTCAQVFKAFLTHCRARVTMSDMAHSTAESYQQILECVWEPRIGEEWFEEVTYSRLQSVIASYAAKIEDATGDDDKNAPTRSEPPLKKSTYNNMVSALRCESPRRTRSRRIPSPSRKRN